MTTIAISRENQKALNAKRRGFEDYNAIVGRLLDGEGETWAELIMIDNEIPQLHTCVFQLGENALCYYHWDGRSIKQISFEETNKLMKQPKPTLTITRDEAELIKEIDEHRVPKGVVEWDRQVKTLLERVEKFLEIQPSDAGKRDP